VLSAGKIGIDGISGVLCRSYLTQCPTQGVTQRATRNATQQCNADNNTGQCAMVNRTLEIIGRNQILSAAGIVWKFAIFFFCHEKLSPFASIL